MSKLKQLRKERDVLKKIYARTQKNSKNTYMSELRFSVMTQLFGYDILIAKETGRLARSK